MLPCIQIQTREYLLFSARPCRRFFLLLTLVGLTRWRRRHSDRQLLLRLAFRRLSNIDFRYVGRSHLSRLVASIVLHCG